MNTFLGVVYLAFSALLLWLVGTSFPDLNGKFNPGLGLGSLLLFVTLIYFLIPYIHFQLRHKPSTWQNTVFIGLSLVSIVTTALVVWDDLLPDTSPIFLLFRPDAFSGEGLFILILMFIIAIASFILSLIFGIVAYYKTKHY